MNIRPQLRFWVLLLVLVSVSATLRPSLPVQSQTKSPQKPPVLYYPGPGDSWQHRRPEDAGMDSALLEQAVAYAKTQPSTMPADFSTQVETFGRVLGPLPKTRGETNGIIIRHGYIVAEWGDTNYVS